MARSRHRRTAVDESGSPEKEKEQATGAAPPGGAESGTILTIRGRAFLAKRDYPLAGVTVAAVAPAEGIEGHTEATIELGRAVSETNGTFAIQTGETSAQQKVTCLLRYCGDFPFRLRCLDRDGSLLHESGPYSFTPDLQVTVAIPESQAVVTKRAWREFGRRMSRFQTARAGALAEELATLAPTGMFGDWTVAQRVAALGALEQAVLDPSAALSRAGVSLSFAALEDEGRVAELREHLPGRARALRAALDAAAGRARAFGTLWATELLLDPGRVASGGVSEAMDVFTPSPVGDIGTFTDALRDNFAWMSSPTIGYRDYLRQLWIDAQPSLHFEAPDPSTEIQRLNTRFHQDFTTTNLTDAPANLILIRIVRDILLSAPGKDYGFGIPAAALPVPGAAPLREHLDRLIALSGLSAEELGRRFRINLTKSDAERSNAVQQNIDTLQRFFTDSYQSVEDPAAVNPDRLPGVEQKLIVSFPAQGAGPFFLEFEEWLERQEPFFGENFFDMRATFRWTTDDRKETRERIEQNSIPLVEFLKGNPSTDRRFDPTDSFWKNAAMKWQWIRNSLDLQGLIQAGHEDFKNLDYVGAEQKYSEALGYVNRLHTYIKPDFAWWNYDPRATAAFQKNLPIRNVAELRNFEALSHVYFGWHYEVLPQYGDIQESSNPPEPTQSWFDSSKERIVSLLDHLEFRYLPCCRSEARFALAKYAEAARDLMSCAGFTVFTGSFDSAFLGYEANSGPLPYSTASNRTTIQPADFNPSMKTPSNPMEKAYFRLKIGTILLEWADSLYRSHRPENVMRARELYKGVLFLHGDIPPISPDWGPAVLGDLSVGAHHALQQTRRNPAVTSQIHRARIGFFQIEQGLNYYGYSAAFLPLSATGSFGRRRSASPRQQGARRETFSTTWRKWTRRSSMKWARGT